MGIYSDATVQENSSSTQLIDNQWVTVDFGNVTMASGWIRFNMFFSASAGSTAISAVSNGGTFYFRNAIVEHVPNGFVHTWYDQSGNGNNATQDTLLSQPQIVTNGVLETASDNGLPALVMERSTGTQRRLNLDSTISTSANLSSFLVGSDKQYTRWLTTTTGRVTTLVGGLWDGVVLAGGANDGEALAPTLNLTNALFSMTKVGTTATYHRNGSLRVTGTCGSTISIFNIHSFPNSSLGRNSLQEAIIYTADQSANRPAIEANIANQYNLTLS
jgi:hypothetical protein